MKKVISGIMLILTAICVLGLSGCFPVKKMYDQAEADAVAAKGTEMMQVWLAENMPDAELAGECTAFTMWTWDNVNEFLSDFATGTILANGEDKTFTINTITGDVYFEIGYDTREKLYGIAEEYFCENLGITSENADDLYNFNFDIMTPVGGDGSERTIPGLPYYDFGLPAGTDDLKSYVCDPSSRHRFFIRCEITVSDETDISAFDLFSMEKLAYNCGMLISDMEISNGNQTFSIYEYSSGYKASYRENGVYLEKDGARLVGCTAARDEEHINGTGGVTVTEYNYVPDDSLYFEATEYGYRLANMSDDLPRCQIYADEGAEILKHDYIAYQIDKSVGYDDFVTGKYDSKKIAESAVNTVWVQESDGSYRLSLEERSNSTLELKGAWVIERAE